jgi:hypothetical protein
MPKNSQNEEQTSIAFNTKLIILPIPLKASEEALIVYASKCGGRT